MTYEPYLSAVRAAPDKGKIIATTLDYPMEMDTLGCTPQVLSENQKGAQALATQAGLLDAAVGHGLDAGGGDIINHQPADP